MGAALPQDSLLSVMSARLPQYNLTGIALNIIQGNTGGDFDVSRATSTMLRDMYAVTQATISSQQAVIDSLRSICAVTARTDSMSAMVAPEIKVLFPQIREIAINRSIVCSVDSSRIDTLNVALVEYGRAMTSADERKFTEYLEARLRRAPFTIVNLK